LSSFAKSLLYDALGQREWLGWVTEEFPNLGNDLRVIGSDRLKSIVPDCVNPMAVVFELSVHFGPDRAAADRFIAQIQQRYRSGTIGPHTIALHPPLLDARSSKTNIEVSIIPIGVGLAVALDRDHPRLDLTTAELTQLGQQLYDLLRGLDGYEVAMVGWDTDRFTRLELQTDYQEELLDGTMTGLVVARDQLASITTSQHFVPFDAYADWIPYRGTTAW
jgi:hypothetical protein